VQREAKRPLPRSEAASSVIFTARARPRPLEARFERRAGCWIPVRTAGRSIGEYPLGREAYGSSIKRATI
jgi:hypothetical protein